MLMDLGGFCSVQIAKSCSYSWCSSWKDAFVFIIGTESQIHRDVAD